ncbi:MAG: F0F1 ATP synthase subunit A [Polyangiales bacterium]
MTAPSPLDSPVVFHLGPVLVTQQVVTSWALVAMLGFAAFLSTRGLDSRHVEPAKPPASGPPTRRKVGRVQAAVEAFYVMLENQIRGVVPGDPAPLVPFVGTLFLFLAFANLCSLIPGVKAPTATLETPGALAIVVFFTVHVFGIRKKGLWKYLKAFAQPSVLMLPLNVLSEITRTFSMMIRLFGNMMSHEFILGIVVTLVGLFVPIPFMALGILIGLIQAYIFAILATVFIGAAIEPTEKAVEKT